jgi:hypothetical protein
MAGNLIKQAAKGKFCASLHLWTALFYDRPMDQRLDTRTYLCYAHSDGEGWEGLCVDLDIGVQGANLNEVVDALNEAVATYIEDAKKEDAATARALLARRAPWHVRAGHFLRAVRHLASPASDRLAAASFDVRCPV